LQKEGKEVMTMNRMFPAWQDAGLPEIDGKLIKSVKNLLRLSRDEWKFISERITPADVEVLNFSIQCSGGVKELYLHRGRDVFDMDVYRKERVLQTAPTPRRAIFRFDSVWTVGYQSASRTSLVFNQVSYSPYTSELIALDTALRCFLEDLDIIPLSCAPTTSVFFPKSE
jgi:hypothetical protein